MIAPNHDPLAQFSRWLEDAEIQSDQEHPNAVALATADSTGRPSVRMVLLKGLSPEGFQFFTNYESRKGEDLASNPRAALCFYWDKLRRQVRVEGTVERLAAEESTAYFQSRARGSQLSAWASPQSREIPSPDFLATKVREIETRFRGQDPLPRPEFWGGYVLKPARIEFWSQGEFRRHERILFEKAGEGWTQKQLAP